MCMDYSIHKQAFVSQNKNTVKPLLEKNYVLRESARQLSCQSFFFDGLLRCAARPVRV